MQLQGHIVGHGLMTIPRYLESPDIDLKYIWNPKLSQEIPFVDSFTITRFLGGYPSKWIKQYKAWDPVLGIQSLAYAVIDDDGGVKYRPDMIEKRLEPYLRAGYRLEDMTLALENVPWAIARNSGAEGLFGQTEPPSSWDAWRLLVEHFADDIRRLYGSDAALHFKMGNCAAR